MLETLPNFKGIIKNYFFDEKKYFEGLRRRFERLRIFFQNQRGDHRRHLHLQRGDHSKISKN